MKKIFIFSIIMLPLFNTSCKSEQKDTTQLVYVCTGIYAKRYHATNQCRWLGSCKGEIVKMSKEEAEQKGLTPCKSCSKDQILK